VRVFEAGSFHELAIITDITDGSDCLMLDRLTTNRLLWFITAVLALVAAGWGVASPHIYAGVIEPSLRPGAFAQDIISVIAAAALLALSSRQRSHRIKDQIVALGLLGYLFYGYGIYVIERAYNGLYLVYLAIFALAFWSLVVAGATMRHQVLARTSLSRSTRLISASGAILQPAIFYPLWIGMLLPLMSSGRKIDSLYSIFILDLCFIMPAFLVLGLMAYRNRSLGLMLLPGMFILGFTLIFSLAIAELVRPLFGRPIAIGPLAISLALSLLFLALGAVHLARLRVEAVPVGRRMFAVRV
jgi:multisubunit Na+/H+ antiporter MnhF subunit